MAVAATEENAIVPAGDDQSSVSFTWTIGGYSQITELRHFSDTFTAGGYKW
jgi:hypothetical protein